jgi:hypothetical protein
MKTIIKRDEFKIIQDDINVNRFSILFSVNSEALIRSIVSTKIILGATISDNYNLVSFNASSVESFKQKQYESVSKEVSYNVRLKMVLDLSLQLNYLIKKYNNTFIGYNPENIIVVDGNKFIYISNEHLLDIDEEEEITITFPFSHSDFLMSPELYNIRELPAKVHYKTAYFSLGSMIICDIDFLKDEDDNKPMYKKTIDKLDSSRLKGSKLYWLIKRCLDEEPKSRSILFI